MFRGRRDGSTPRISVPSFDLPGYQAHICCIYIHVGKTPIGTKQNKSKFLFFFEKKKKGSDIYKIQGSKYLEEIFKF